MMLGIKNDVKRVTKDTHFFSKTTTATHSGKEEFFFGDMVVHNDDGLWLMLIIYFKV